uniref:Transcription factor CP2-like 1 n=1 Tax=Electrophorus electricus TaxID=8005 RepID=A0A4W4FHD6_ELEEL
MLYWRTQPDIYYQRAPSHKPRSLGMGGVSNKQLGLPPLQYVLCETTLTCLNQGATRFSCALLFGNEHKPGTKVCVHDGKLDYIYGPSRSRAKPAHYTVEFLWDPVKCASVFVQVHSQPGNAEEGMGLLSEFRWTLSFPTSGEYLEHVHASSCQIKVFKPKGADSTGGTLIALLLFALKTHILSFSSLETQERLHQNNFSTFCRLFTDFSAADSLNMSRDDVVQICCPADSIRLFDTIKGRPSHLTVYVSQQKIRNQLRGRPACNDVTTKLTLLALTEKLASLYGVSAQQICRVYRQGPTRIHVLMMQTFIEETSSITSALRGNSQTRYLRHITTGPFMRCNPKQITATVTPQ